MEDISLKSDESEVEVGTTIDCNVSLTPIDTTDDFTLTIVPGRTTADARLSKEGVLTALSTGIVTVRAECVENPALNCEKTVTIILVRQSLGKRYKCSRSLHLQMRRNARLHGLCKMVQVQQLLTKRAC